MQLVRQESRNIVLEFLTNFPSKSTRAAYSSDLKEFFDYYNGLFANPSEITLAHLIQYREFVSSKLSPMSVNRKLSGVKSFLSWCASQSIITSNPSSALKMVKANPTDPTQAFTDSETVEILKQPDINTFSGSMHRIVLELLFKLGLRRSEVSQIMLRDIYEDRGQRVLRVTGKGGKVRLLPISSELWAIIDRHIKLFDKDLQKDAFFVHSEGFSTMNPSTVFRIVRRYAEQVGIDRRVGAHSCRATVISHLLENSVSPRDVADFAGHTSIQTTIGSYDKKRDGIKNSAAFKVNFEREEKC